MNVIVSSILCPHVSLTLKFIEDLRICGYKCCQIITGMRHCYLDVILVGGISLIESWVESSKIGKVKNKQLGCFMFSGHLGSIGVGWNCVSS